MLVTLTGFSCPSASQSPLSASNSQHLPSLRKTEPPSVQNWSSHVSEIRFSFLSTHLLLLITHSGTRSCRVAGQYGDSGRATAGRDWPDRKASKVLCTHDRLTLQYCPRLLLPSVVSRNSSPARHTYLVVSSNANTAGAQPLRDTHHLLLPAVATGRTSSAFTFVRGREAADLLGSSG